MTDDILRAYAGIDFSPLDALTGDEVVTHSPVRDVRLPDDEDLECRNKAAALLAAVPAARRMTAKRSRLGTPA